MGIWSKDIQHVKNCYDILGPVVQNFVSLSPQFVNYVSTSKANTLIFLCIKCESPLHCKGFSHFFNKNNSVFVILPFEILAIR